MILDRMKQVMIDKFELDTSGMTRDTVFRNEGLGFDSMSFMEYLCFLETEFDVTISDEDLEPMSTLGHLEDHIAKNGKKI